MFKRKCGDDNHKFEARYDIELLDCSKHDHSPEGTVCLTSEVPKQTYVKDVCVHCGKEIKR